MSETRIGIVGLGAVSGYGWGVDSLWTGLLSGKSAAQQVKFEDFAGLAVLVPDGGNEEDSVTLVRSGVVRVWPRGGG